jgi:hypothetical protein
MPLEKRDETMTFGMDWVFMVFLALPGGEPAASRGGFDLDASPEADLERRLGAQSDTTGADQEGGKPDQEDEKPQRPQGPVAPATQESSSFLDFGWLELYPRAGLAVFSSKYHINASPTVEIEGRAPLPWLSPASNPGGDYFGAFAQLNGALIKRTLQPVLPKASGIMLSLALGLDYTIFRDDTWLLMARAGVQYTYYGGITDLRDGAQVVAGLTAGVSLTRSLMLTLTPEIIYAKTGDYILMGLLGLAVEF